MAGALSIAANLLLCMLLSQPFQVAGLAFASAVSSVLYALLLLIPMERRGEGVLDKHMGIDLLKMLAASVVMALCANWTRQGINGLLPVGKLSDLIALGLCALVGVIVYFVLALVLRIQEATLTLSLFKRGK